MAKQATAGQVKGQAVTLNTDQRLYVIPDGRGFSCLGFDVLIERYNRLATELGGEAAIGRGHVSEPPFPAELHGTLEGYARYQALLDRARFTGRRFSCELSPQLIGLEGNRVEVETLYGETRRFIVGKSTGWIPIHLEIHNRRSTGGGGAEREYKSVRVVGRGRY